MKKQKKIIIISAISIIIIVIAIIVGIIVSKNNKSTDENNTIINNEIDNNSNSENEQIIDEMNTSEFFDQEVEYVATLESNENGVAAIVKVGEDTFRTEQKEGYYVYVDNFGNTYNIKEIVDVTDSTYIATGKDGESVLFKCTIVYLDDQDKKQSFDTAVILTKDHTITIMGNYDQYTGSTSFVRSFAYLSEGEENTSSFFSQKLEYLSPIESNENGLIAIIKAGEDTFRTEQQDGYYIYRDNFGNEYNIKEIIDVSNSTYTMTGNENWAVLFKCTINYVDDQDQRQSFDTAVVLTKEYSVQIRGNYDQYTGTTSFVRSFTNLTEDANEESENKSSFFDQQAEYSDTLESNVNGLVAIVKAGEDTFRTEQKDGYYIYKDGFGNTYNIKEITGVSSPTYTATGNEGWAVLFRCTVEYIDNQNRNQSFDVAVVLTKEHEVEIMGDYDRYTGTTSFYRSFGSMSED